MAQLSMRPCGDFRTTYKSDTPIFETKTIRSLAIAGVIAMLLRRWYWIFTSSTCLFRLRTSVLRPLV